MDHRLMVALIFTALAGCATPVTPGDPVTGATPLTSSPPSDQSSAAPAASPAPPQAAGSGQAPARVSPSASPTTGSGQAPARVSPSVSPTTGSGQAPARASASPTSDPPTPTSTPEPGVPAPTPAALVLVEGGSMRTKNGREVTLDSFYIGATEVTQAEYAGAMGGNPSLFKGDDRPVEQVSWWDAIKYCNARSRAEGFPVAYNEATGELLNADGRFMFWPNNFVSSPQDARYRFPLQLYDFSLDASQLKGYRLPTNTEWDFAATGGTQTKGYAYSGRDNPPDVAVYLDNADGATAPVGSKLPNELGLYDMSGNVWEWVGEIAEPVDWGDTMPNFYDSLRSLQAHNPYATGRMYNKVLIPDYLGVKEFTKDDTRWPNRRGGSWGNGANDVKFSTRLSSSPDHGHSTVGFRVVRFQ